MSSECPLNVCFFREFNVETHDNRLFPQETFETYINFLRENILYCESVIHTLYKGSLMSLKENI